MSPPAGATAGAEVEGERFDAYVSYVEGDRAWVEEELAPRLREAGVSLCLEDDLPPGGIEVEERSRAVAASRKTLLVLTPAYLDHDWGPLEEAITRELDPAARKRRLVPLLLGDCELPLRIRPLVSVDLRPGAARERQWRRLERALDPAREESAGAVQRLSLRLAEATADLERPSWNAAGTAWLATAYFVLASLAALVYLHFREVSALREALGLLLVMPGHALAALVWREDRDVFRRLSHLTTRSLPLRGGLAGLAAVAAALWWIVGVPAVRAVTCGPWGCREAGKTYLTFIGSATADAAASGPVFATLVQKLAPISEVQVLGSHLPQIGDGELRLLDVDYTISGYWTPRPVPTFTAALYDARHRPAHPWVNVPGWPTGTGEPSVTAGGPAPEDRLVFALLERLGIEIPPELRARIVAIPTGNPHAREVGARAFERMQEGRYEEAEVPLRLAVELDPGFGIAWSHLAEVARRGGRPEEALGHRRRAVETLPTYAPFRYNLGQQLASMGRADEARAELERAVELDPAHVPAYNELGNVLVELGRPEAAAEALGRGGALDPTSAPLAKNLGRARLAGGAPAGAVEPLERALRLYAADDWLGRAEAHALLVEAFARLGDVDSACERLAGLHRLDPAGVSPWTPAADASAAPLGCPTAAPEEDLHAWPAG